MIQRHATLALAGIGMLAAVPLQAQARRALIIGINQYKAAESAEPAGPVVSDRPTKSSRGGAWTNLEGCVNDAASVKEVLKARFGFKEEEITFLANGQATRQGILDALRTRLVEPTRPGDVVFFYYAGHGSQVRNTLSQEADKLDESLVPSDVAQGAADIRDKELKPIFNAILDRGATFTAIFDSCHSGSISRGAPGPVRFRKIEPELTDVKDPVKDLPEPGKRGALILSAAQDFEPAGERRDANGTEHGLFTSAFLQAMQVAPDHEPVRRTFLRIRSIMQSAGSIQEPVLEGSEERLGRDLLGASAARGQEVRAMAASAVQEDGLVVVQGGTVHGLTPGTELTPLNGKEAPGLVLKVEEITGLSRSLASVKGGKLPASVQGVLFQVSQWAPPARPDLTVAMGVSDLSPEALADLAQALASLKTQPAVRWVDDPTLATPDLVLQAEGARWVLVGAGGRKVPVQGPLEVRTVLAAVAATGLRTPALWVNLPLPKAVADRMPFAPGRATPAIAVSPSGATYALASRLTDRGLAYAWVLPGALAADEGRVRLPVRTDWFALEAGPEAPATLGARLEEYAGRLARLRGWLELAPPAQGTADAFPYLLRLKRVGDGTLLPAGDLRPSEQGEGAAKRRGAEELTLFGERYRPVLVLDTTRPAKDLQWIRPQFVYVLAIDSKGTGTLLFPTSGTVENRFPTGKASEPAPPEIDLFPNPRTAIRIQPPAGVDHYLLLTTEEPIPDLSVFQFEGVRTRGGGSAGNALSRLLKRVGAGTRGSGVEGDAVPVNWGVSRFSVRSVEK